MKGVKKIALASLVAAAPFAQAELTAMDDEFLGEMTGQAGISIELDTAVTIGSVVYTDTDGLAVAKGGSGTAGSISINNVAFGGATVAGGVGDARFDDVLIEIDVDATGGIVIHRGGTNFPGMIDGTAAVDYGLHVDSITASGLTNPLVGNINIAGNIGPSDVTINNTTGSDLISVAAYFEVTSGSMDIAVAGLGISNLTVGQDASPIHAGSYATAISDLITSGDAANSTGVDNMAFSETTIGTQDVTFFNTSTGALDTVTNALSFGVTSLNIDVAMDVSLGGRNIGNLALNDLDLSGTTLNIFGH